MAKQSAGILLYRKQKQTVEVLLVHPGGPFWAKKDAYSWSIPKGEIDESEEVLAAAKREFAEELGLSAPEVTYEALGQAKLASGKIVHAWTAEADLDLANFKSGMFEMQWPPKSGTMQEFPEVDKAEWFQFTSARTKINKGQLVFLERLAEKIGVTMAEEKASAAPKQTSLF